MTMMGFKNLNRKFATLAVAAGVATFGLTGVAQAQAESGLVGIKLYDTGVRVVSVYGTPNDIQAVGGGAGAVGPGRGPAGGGGGPAAPGGRGGGGGATAAASDFRHSPNPFGFGDEILRQAAPAPLPGGGGGPGGRDGSGGPAGLEGPPGSGPGGGGGGQAGNAERTVYTRWVYNRGNSRYGFVMDKFNRVVQIEAIGMNDGRVRTRRGIGFGSSFANIIRNYQAPDAYEISGDHIMVRYLVRQNVAFRLSRLQPGRPHVVTGVVVAAGKA
jgi:hypothetical protein